MAFDLGLISCAIAHSTVLKTGRRRAGAGYRMAISLQKSVETQHTNQTGLCALTGVASLLYFPCLFSVKPDIWQTAPVDGIGQSMRNIKKIIPALVVLGVSTLGVLAQTDPAEIVTSATGKYNTAVAVFISAAVIGAAILYIRKGLRGRM